MDPVQLFAGLDPNQYTGAAGIGLVIALTNVTKKFLNDERWFPVISIALGICWNTMLVFVFSGDYRKALIDGVVTGLSAAGLYSMVGSSTRADIKAGKVAGLMAVPRVP